MAFFWFPWTLVLMAAPTPAPGADGAHPDAKTVATLAGRAVGGDAQALGELRAMGPEGLDLLLQVRSELSSVPPFPSDDPRARAWDGMIDRVARQQHATASGLYWYTDLAQAKARAAKEGKAIVSLRLLGALDEVLSCANSRFFRTLLYPDPAVRAALHDRFILHWESVRQAPKITIDFGDGKVLTRTVTGNSMHYLLDAKGRVVDALPGVVGPAAFVAWLDEVDGFARKSVALADPAFVSARARVHTAWRTSTLARWRVALKDIGIVVGGGEDELAAATTEDVIARLGEARPGALRMDPTAQSMLERLYADRGEPPMGPDRTRTDRPTAERAAPLAVSKMAVERPMLPWLRNLRGKVAQDEVQNDFVLHTRIRGMLAASEEVDPSAFTAPIYASVFLTPLDDPYMGLAAPDVFSAIPPDVEKPVAAARDDR
ncbi:MAG: hypothetical protein U1F43_03260 [Myxococcota bacterium]